MRSSGLPGLRAVVAGGGIAGLVLALSLHEVGISVEVYEAAPEIRPLGVGINLQPHAVRELDALGLMHELSSRSVAPRRLLYTTKRGEHIWAEDRGLAAGYPWPQLSVHRGVLHQVLLAAVKVRLGAQRLHAGHRLVRVEEPDGNPQAVFAVSHLRGGAQGQEERRIAADVIVAADGIHSALRQQFYPDEGAPLWNGAVLWRGFAAAPRLLDGRTMVWAGHADQKFVAYPIQNLGPDIQGLNFIAELRTPGWEYADREDWNRPGVLDDFLPAFESWRFGWLDVPDLIRRADSTYVFPMVDRDPLPRWTHGNTTLIGDAAHPMYPIGSNGASQAILDARLLAGCLALESGEPSRALERYEGLRRPVTSSLVLANRQLGPERPMQIVEQRASEGFARIEDVISQDEILEATREYRAAAGLLHEDLLKGKSIVDQLGQ